MNSHFIDTGLQSVLQTIQAVTIGSSVAQKSGYLNLYGDMLSFYRNQWNMPMDGPYEELVKQMHEPADQLLVAAIDAESRGLTEAAARFAESAAIIDHQIQFFIASSAFFRKNGNITRSRKILQALALNHPESQDILSELFMCDVFENFWSHDYYDQFADIHRKYKPRVYLEIGVATGKSLALARKGTRAIGIDPALEDKSPLIYHSPENTPQLYGMTSDDFFTTIDIVREMGQTTFDVAFIDGLHHFDQVLRDFINLEKFAGPDSVILIHDCLPVNSRVAARDRSTAFWTGDVWKIIPCLKAVRPDLEIITLPAPPAGLAMVRRLDPASRILNRQYMTIREQFDDLVLPESWPERCRLLAVETDETTFNLRDYLPSGGWS